MILPGMEILYVEVWTPINYGQYRPIFDPVGGWTLPPHVFGRFHINAQTLLKNATRALTGITFI